jgi:hypothetical protein
MTPNAINSLAQAVPGVRQERHLPEWPRDLELVAGTDELVGDIDDDLVAEAGEADAVRTIQPDSLTALRDVEDAIEGADIPEHDAYADLRDLSDRIVETVGTGFPGAPGGVAAGCAPSSAFAPNSCQRE